MEIRPAEKLMLVMLSEIYQKLGCDGVDPVLVRKAIYSGNYWALDWEYPGIFGAEQRDKNVVRETVDILEMWNFIEEAGGPRFPGFDGKNESDYASVSRMLTEHMDRFPIFRGRTHQGMRALEGYRRMLRKFETLRPRLGDRHLSKDEIASLMAERVRPHGT